MSNGYKDYSLDELFKELNNCLVEHSDLTAVLASANSNVSNCVGNINKIQEEIDRRILSMKQSSPTSSVWRRTLSFKDNKVI